MTPAGLYVHVPFCLTRCGYCDFNTYAGLDHLGGPYAAALLAEADLHAGDWEPVEFASLFLGGGTPTMLPGAAFGSLLEGVRKRFRVASGAEVTSEANPDTVEARSLAAIRNHGVTRLSIGVQSFDPPVLEALERVHSPDSARAAFEAARLAGFSDVNLDLIYGAHGETLGSWRRTLEEAIALGPEHVSAYALTVEPATPLGRKVAAGAIPAPDSDLQADMYEFACAALAQAGYEHYEVSNWATPGHRCVHNLGYWEGRPYLGLGAGAHSYRDGRRWWNVRPPQAYMNLVGRGRLPLGGEERPGPDERRMEQLLLGLRVADGIPADWVDVPEAERFTSAGLARRRNGRLVLTDRGLLLVNEVALALSGKR